MNSFAPGTACAHLRTFLIDTAEKNWPANYGWTRTGAVEVTPAADAQNVSMTPFINIGTTTPTEPQMLAELTALSANEQKDRTETLAAAAGRLTGGAAAHMWFPATGTNSVTTTLAGHARDQNLMWVRVEYQIMSSTGGLTVNVNGPGISRTVTYLGTSGTTRRVAEFTINRGASTSPASDILKLTGNNVRVFATSIRASLPYKSNITTSSYEFVLLEDGVAYDRAFELAKRHVYANVAGRLMRPHSTALLNELTTNLAPQHIGLVDARSPNGADSTFKTFAGTSVPSSLFVTGTNFTVARPRGAWAYANDASMGMRLSHAHPGVAAQGKKLGFWVEYPGTGNGTAQAMMAPPGADNAEPGTMAALAEAFMELFSSDEPTTTTLPIGETNDAPPVDESDVAVVETAPPADCDSDLEPCD